MFIYNPFYGAELILQVTRMEILNGRFRRRSPTL
jgi:hypothetical protein